MKATKRPLWMANILAGVDDMIPAGQESEFRNWRNAELVRRVRDRAKGEPPDIRRHMVHRGAKSFRETENWIVCGEHFPVDPTLPMRPPLVMGRPGAVRLRIYHERPWKKTWRAGGIYEARAIMPRWSKASAW